MSDDCPLVNEFNETRYEWVLDAFGACVYSPAQCAAVFVGFLSIGCWLFAQMPQIYENFRNKSASALSVGFLMFWTLGDSSNLVGCVLTDQLPTQTYTAIYFCFVDVILWSQYGYYSYIYPRFFLLPGTDDEKTKLINDDNVPSSDDNTSTAVNNDGDPMKAFEAKQQQPKKKRVSRRGSYLFAVTLLGTGVALINLATSISLLSQDKSNNSNIKGFGLSRSLLAFGNNSSGSDDTATDIAGTVIAWLCAALYLSSRMPQILLNWQRGSVAGLSIHLFIFAVLGNLTYVLSIFLSVAYVTELLDSLPYIIGSGGTLFFDFTIFIQFHIFRAKTGQAEIVP